MAQRHQSGVADLKPDCLSQSRSLRQALGRSKAGALLSLPVRQFPNGTATAARVASTRKAGDEISPFPALRCARRSSTVSFFNGANVLRFDRLPGRRWGPRA